MAFFSEFKLTNPFTETEEPPTPMSNLPMTPMLGSLPMGDYRQRSNSIIEFDMQSFQNYTQSRSMSLPMIMMPMEPFESNLFSITEQPQMQRSHHMRKGSFASADSSVGEKQFKCTHPGCDRAFNRIQNLRSHSRCHLQIAPHQCKSCGSCFKRTTDLQRHIRTMHLPDSQKPWTCNRCGKRFGRSDALKRHLSSRSKDHACPGGSMPSHSADYPSSEDKMVIPNYFQSTDPLASM